MRARASENVARTPSPDGVRSRSRSPPLDDASGSSGATRRDGARWTDRARRERAVQPMRDVILLGLDADVDAEALRTLVRTLADMVGARLAAPPSDVTVIRDRTTGASKGFGFAKFDTLDDAKRFVSVHAPFIENAERWLGPPRAGAGAAAGRQRRKRIKVDYSDSERPQGGLSYYEQHNAPGCKEQLKRSRARRAQRETNSPPASAPAPQPEAPDVQCENAGVRDASLFPTEMLLLTGLGATHTAADVGAALCALACSAAVAPDAPRAMPSKVLLVRERASRSSRRFAFAVFDRTDAAKACLQAVRNPALCPNGFLAHVGGAARSSFADAVVFEESDPYDPTSSPWSFTDRLGKTWRYEDEQLGFDVWDAPAAPEAAAATAAAARPRLAAPSTATYVSEALYQRPTVLEPPRFAAPATHAQLRRLDYADVQRKVCLLCQRQFKSSVLLTRHAAESALHSANLEDEAMCRAGAARVRALHAGSVGGAAAALPKENSGAGAPLLARVASPSVDTKLPVYDPAMTAPTSLFTYEPRESSRVLQPVGWNASSAAYGTPYAIPLGVAPLDAAADPFSGHAYRKLAPAYAAQVPHHVSIL